jgi:glyoxylase-like metal-dependent hydrolase (beta-lactamase superfamily II)
MTEQCVDNGEGGGNGPNELADGVIEIDTRLGGWEHLTAGYLLAGPSPVLVETGSQSSLPVLLESLAALGVDAGELAGVAVTHIHLDHAGGVGDVARAFPSARVYVHERGARHLVDPRRLVASAAMVYGEKLDSLYGRLEPTPGERVTVLGDGDAVDLGGGRQLTAIDSPGHAKHHLGFLDSSSGLLFAGDAVGVKLPGGGALRPATPPPDFDLELAMRSLQRFAQQRPVGVALAHYGLIPGDPLELLDDAARRLNAWAAEATRAWRAGEDIAAALQACFGDESEKADPVQRERLDVLNGFHSNAAGFRRWLETHEASEPPAAHDVRRAGSA